MRLWIIVSIAVVICAVCIDAGKSDSAEKKEDSGSADDKLASESAADGGDGGNKQNEDDAKAAPSPVVNDGKKGDENEAETCTAPKSQEYEVNIKVSGKIGHLVKVLKAIEKAEQPSNNCGQNKQKSGKQGSDEENKEGDDDEVASAELKDNVAYKSQSEDSGKASDSVPSNESGQDEDKGSPASVDSPASENDDNPESGADKKRRRRRRR